LAPSANSGYESYGGVHTHGGVESAACRLEHVH
jgi:hypothetical protein